MQNGCNLSEFTLTVTLMTILYTATRKEKGRNKEGFGRLQSIIFLVDPFDDKFDCILSKLCSPHKTAFLVTEAYRFFMAELNSLRGAQKGPRRTR